ncbi:uncharacterized protein LOC142320680 [Lycorma delicatula]|uniref:uncharacterized protein LOC142320680 n=1 Tax=Lycorma delicatula TaxID=130591 RepID=UPI003F517421
MRTLILISLFIASVVILQVRGEEEGTPDQLSLLLKNVDKAIKQEMAAFQRRTDGLTEIAKEKMEGLSDRIKELLKSPHGEEERIRDQLKSNNNMDETFKQQMADYKKITDDLTEITKEKVGEINDKIHEFLKSVRKRRSQQTYEENQEFQEVKKNRNSA